MAVKLPSAIAAKASGSPLMPAISVWGPKRPRARAASRAASASGSERPIIASIGSAISCSAA